MSFSPAFTVAQNFSQPSILVVNDTSTGSDVAITGRRVYIQQADGTYLVPTGTNTNYVNWPLGPSFININVLNQDYALSITVEWMVATVPQYTVNALFAFTLNSELFYYNLTQYIASGQIPIRDSSYYQNKLLLRTFIDECNSAVNYGNDIKSAQDALNRAQYLIANQNFLF